MDPVVEEDHPELLVKHQDVVLYVEEHGDSGGVPAFPTQLTVTSLATFCPLIGGGRVLGWSNGKPALLTHMPHTSLAPTQ